MTSEIRVKLFSFLFSLLELKKKEQFYDDDNDDESVPCRTKKTTRKKEWRRTRIISKETKRIQQT